MAPGMDWIREAEGESPASAMQRGMAGAILAFAGGVIMMIDAVFSGITDVLDVFSAARDFFMAMLTAPIPLIEGGAMHTLRSITVGEWAFFGPATLTVAIASVAGAWLVWSALDPEIPLVDDLIWWR